MRGVGCPGLGTEAKTAPEERETHDSTHGHKYSGPIRLANSVAHRQATSMLQLLFYGVKGRVTGLPGMPGLDLAGG